MEAHNIDSAQLAAGVTGSNVLSPVDTNRLSTFKAVRRFECSDLTVQIVMKGLSEVHQQETEVSPHVQRGVEFRSTAQRCPAQYAGNRTSVISVSASSPKEKDARCKTQTCTWSVY
jgi:hypothetical protein